MDLPKSSDLSESEAVEMLDGFRTWAYQNDYCFRFKLKHYPHRAKTRELLGTLWGMYDKATRTHYQRVVVEEADPYSSRKFKELARYLLIRGAVPEAWVMLDDGIIRELAPEQWMDPLVDGVSLTVFDLLMPYLYWENADYLGPSRIKARPAQSFAMFPGDLEPQFEGIDSVRVSFDDEFKGMLQSEWLGPDGETLRSIQLVSLKKTQGQHLPKTVDYRDNLSRDKSRLEIVAAAMDVYFDATLFVPSNLALPMVPLQPGDFSIL